ncbi:hypothetical protein EB093_07535, partial [bacterium]|nr:hypothetical protein [bacterium]
MPLVGNGRWRLVYYLGLLIWTPFRNDRWELEILVSESQKMEKYTYINNANPAFVEEIYNQYLTDPNSVDLYWKRFFEGYDFSLSELGSAASPAFAKEVAVSKLIDGYRVRGHLLSQTNPVRPRRVHKVDLELDYFGLSEADLNSEFDAGNELGLGRTT